MVNEADVKTKKMRLERRPVGAQQETRDPNFGVNGGLRSPPDEPSQTLLGISVIEGNLLWATN